VKARLVFLAALLSASVAFAASDVATRGGPGGCCTLLLWIIWLRVYRSGGVDWPLAIGATVFPGVLGWFVWRNREHGNGARWLGLITASLHAFFFLLGVVLALFLPSYLKRAAAAAEGGVPSFSKPVDLSQVKEDPSLGLHPPAHITTNPTGAVVFIDGEKRGVTPLETPLAAGAQNQLKLELPGYFPVNTTRSPNARERLDLSFTLQPAGQLEVVTEPPGARVFAGRKKVLDASPGHTALLELGEVELLVIADGCLPLHETRTITQGTSSWNVALERGVPITLEAKPLEGEVFLDGQWIGETPLSFAVPSTGKHQLEVRRETWSTWTKKLEKLKKPARFTAVLVDADRVKAEATAKRTRAAYARAEAALNQVQEKLDRALNPSPSLERQRVALERDMEKAAGDLEKAEARLRAVVEARERGLPPPDPE
jgi:hypothetical protein